MSDLCLDANPGDKLFFPGMDRSAHTAAQLVHPSEAASREDSGATVPSVLLPPGRTLSVPSQRGSLFQTTRVTVWVAEALSMRQARLWKEGGLGVSAWLLTEGPCSRSLSTLIL